MRYDVIVMGGGMSALACGIAIAMDGKNVALMVKGQSKLTYNSGSIDLLGFDQDGQMVESPLDAIARLPESHPYSKMSAADLAHNASMVPVIMNGAGLKVYGDSDHNHYRLTPLGKWRPAWLTLDDYVALDSLDALPWNHVAVVGIKGFLDFPSVYVNAAFEKMGVVSKLIDVKLPAVEKLINGQTTLRSNAVAQLMQNDGVLADLARRIKNELGNAQLVALPAVLGNEDDEPVMRLQQLLGTDVKLVPTLPPSIAGARMLSRLRKLFIKHGGTYLLGSMVKDGVIENGRVQCIHAKNFPDQDIVADHYVLATGSFMSGGLVASSEDVCEPIFGLDIDSNEKRAQWTRECLFDAQPYMEFGVRTDSAFHVFKNGEPVENLYAIGSILSGHNSLRLADDTGVAIMTGIQVARSLRAQILPK